MLQRVLSVLLVQAPMVWTQELRNQTVVSLFCMFTDAFKRSPEASSVKFHVRKTMKPEGYGGTGSSCTICPVDKFKAGFENGTCAACSTLGPDQTTDGLDGQGSCGKKVTCDV